MIAYGIGIFVGLWAADRHPEGQRAWPVLVVSLGIGLVAAAFGGHW